MSMSVSIEVTCDSDGEGGLETFGVVSEHKPELPKPFNEKLQAWERGNFEGEVEHGETIHEAGKMVHELHGEIIEFPKKS